MDVRNIDIANANILLREICSSGGLDFRELKNRSGLLHQDMMSALRTLFGPDYIYKDSSAGTSGYKYCATPSGMAIFQRGGLPSDPDAYAHQVEQVKKSHAQPAQSYQYLWMGGEDEWGESPLPVYNMGKSYGELSLNILLEKFKPVPIIAAISRAADLVNKGAWDAFIVKGDYAGKRDELGRPLIENVVKEKDISDLFRDPSGDMSASSNDLLSAFEGLSNGFPADNSKSGTSDIYGSVGDIFGQGTGFEEMDAPFDLDDVPF